jgi:hypothetical protein
MFLDIRVTVMLFLRPLKPRCQRSTFGHRQQPKAIFLGQGNRLVSQSVLALFPRFQRGHSRREPRSTAPSVQSGSSLDVRQPQKCQDVRTDRTLWRSRRRRRRYPRPTMTTPSFTYATDMLSPHTRVGRLATKVRGNLNPKPFTFPSALFERSSALGTDSLEASAQSMEQKDKAYGTILDWIAAIRIPARERLATPVQAEAELPAPIRGM